MGLRDGEAPRASNCGKLLTPLCQNGQGKGGQCYHSPLGAGLRQSSCLIGPVWPQRNIATARTMADQGRNEDNIYPNFSLSVLRSTASASPWLNPAKARGQGTPGYTIGREISLPGHKAGRKRTEGKSKGQRENNGHRATWH